MATSSTPRPFRVHSKYLFLTYPKCFLTPQDALGMLLSLLFKYEPQYICVVKENHRDGTPHLHVLIQNKKRTSITNQRTLDLTHFVSFNDNEDWITYHPNIQAAEDCNSVRDYITKDVDSETNMAEYGTFVEVSSPGRKDKDFDMKQIIATATTRDEFLSMCRSRFTFEWVVRLPQFEYTARHLFPDPIPQYTPDFPTESLMCHETIQNWKETQLFSVSLDSYILCTSTPSDEALANLRWMDEYTRSHQDGTSPSTSADQPGQEKLPGQGL